MTKDKSPRKNNRQVAQQRTLQIAFVVISVVMILSMILMQMR